MNPIGYAINFSILFKCKTDCILFFSRAYAFRFGKEFKIMTDTSGTLKLNDKNRQNVHSFTSTSKINKKRFNSELAINVRMVLFNSQNKCYNFYYKLIS